jgi:class 3 adenylate cyclase
MKRTNRTWLCSVLFMDIVDYSKLSVDQQMLVKQSFSTLVSDALKSLPDEDCIKLDTGDGVAVCYLGAPEDVLYAAIGLRDAFIEVKSICETCYSVRMGINLGPIKIIEDINGNRNTIGDGINVAQRIMSFSSPNQLLVSRAYYDVVSCLSDESPEMFNHIGVHSDKHVREHDVYEVVTSKNHIQSAALFSDTPKAATAGSQRATGIDLDERIQKIVREELARIIGPMAGVLLKRAMKSSSNLDELFEQLAEEIPSGEEKDRFLKSRNSLH